MIAVLVPVNLMLVQGVPYVPTQGPHTVTAVMAAFRGVSTGVMFVINLDPPRDQRESRKNLDLDNFWLVSRNLGLDNLEIVVSTKSRSRQLTNHESRANLDLDNFENLSLVQVSISTIFRFFILESRFLRTLQMLSK